MHPKANWTKFHRTYPILIPESWTVQSGGSYVKFPTFTDKAHTVTHTRTQIWNKAVTTWCHLTHPSTPSRLLAVCLYICLSVCLSVSLSVCVCICVCVYVWLQDVRVSQLYMTVLTSVQRHTPAVLIGHCLDLVMDDMTLTLVTLLVNRVCYSSSTRSILHSLLAIHFTLSPAFAASRYQHSPPAISRWSVSTLKCRISIATRDRA